MGQVILRVQKVFAVLALLPIVLTPQLALSESSKVFTIKGNHKVTLDFSYARKLIAKLPKNATLGHFYDQANRHLSPKHREQFLRHFNRQGSWRDFKLPEAQFGSDSITFIESENSEKKLYKMQFVLNEHTYVKINGNAIKYQQLHRPKELYKQMGALSAQSQNAGKYSFLLNLFLPKAEAFFGGGGMGMMMMMMMLPMMMGGGGGGGIMSILPMMMMLPMMMGGFGSSSSKSTY